MAMKKFGDGVSWNDTFTGFPALITQTQRDGTTSESVHKREQKNENRKIIDVSRQNLHHIWLKVQHGCRNVQAGVTLVCNTVHVLNRVTGQSVNQNANGFRLGHGFNLKENQEVHLRILGKTSMKDFLSICTQIIKQQYSYISINVIIMIYNVHI